VLERLKNNPTFGHLDWPSQNSIRFNAYDSMHSDVIMEVTGDASPRIYSMGTTMQFVPPPHFMSLCMILSVVQACITCSAVHARTHTTERGLPGLDS